MKTLAALYLLVGFWSSAGWAENPLRGRSTDGECLMCHSAPRLERAALRVEGERFGRSVHGGLRCVDCHRDLAGGGRPHAKKAERVDCAGCHRADNPFGAPDVKSRTGYGDSVHGRAVARGDPDAPRCADCHGDHYILSHDNPASPVSRGKVPGICGGCHSDAALVSRHHFAKGEALKFYQRSVHGRALEAKGLTVAAICTDCHGVHDIRISSDPRSSASRPHIPATCGRCHRGLYHAYLGGIHGRDFLRGVKEAPVCTDCHGEHTIRSPQEEASSVHPLHIARTCSHCHEDVRIERRFGLPAQRLSTYLDSYHGVANRYGDITVANCATCHGAHAILPSSDPRSSINKRNLPRTCGRCHPGAGENFARGSVHILPSRERDRGVYWVRKFYQVFIGGLVAAFLGYILLDLLSRWRRRGEKEERR